MVATFVSESDNQTAAAGSITVNAPSGDAAGSRLLIVRVGGATSGITWTAPADAVAWNGPYGATGRGATFYKIGGGSEPASYTFSRTGGGGTLRITAERWTSYDSTTPVPSPATTGIAGTDATSANAVSPAVTSAASNTALDCGLVNLGSNTSGVTKPASMTQTYQFTTTAFRAGAVETVGSGSTGTRTWTSPLATSYTSSVVINQLSAQTVSPGGIDSTATIGSPTVTAGPVTVSPGGIDSTATVGTPTMVPGAVTISPGGVDSTATVGSPTITSLVTITPGGIDSTATVGAPTVTAGTVTVSPPGIDSTITAGEPTVAPGSVVVSPGGIDSTALLGIPTIVPGPVLVEPAGIDSTALIGTPTITAGGSTVSPGGINSSATVGTPAVERQPAVAGVVYNHETGAAVGAGIVVKLFDDNDLLVDTTLTDAGGGFIFYRPFGDTDLYWTLAYYEISGVQYHGTSDRGCPST